MWGLITTKIIWTWWDRHLVLGIVWHEDCEVWPLTDTIGNSFRGCSGSPSVPRQYQYVPQIVGVTRVFLPHKFNAMLMIVHIFSCGKAGQIKRLYGKVIVVVGRRSRKGLTGVVLWCWVVLWLFWCLTMSSCSPESAAYYLWVEKSLERGWLGTLWDRRWEMKWLLIGRHYVSEFHTTKAH